MKNTSTKLEMAPNNVIAFPQQPATVPNDGLDISAYLTQGTNGLVIESADNEMIRLADAKTGELVWLIAYVGHARKKEIYGSANQF